MTTEAELKEIRDLLIELNRKIEGMNSLMERSLIGCEEPLPDEVEATKEYESNKKDKKLQLVPWNSAKGSIAIAAKSRFHRKESTETTFKVA